MVEPLNETLSDLFMQQGNDPEKDKCFIRLTKGNTKTYFSAVIQTLTFNEKGLPQNLVLRIVGGPGFKKIIQVGGVQILGENNG